MLTKTENYIIIGLWFFFFCLYYFIFKNENTIYKILVISFMMMSVFKSLYDIKYKTGYKDMYCYSEKTNQILRFFVFLVALIFATIGNFMLLEIKVL